MISFNFHHQISSFNAVHGDGLFKNKAKPFANNSNQEVKHYDDTKEVAKDISKEPINIFNSIWKIDLVLTSCDK